MRQKLAVLLLATLFTLSAGTQAESSIGRNVAGPNGTECFQAPDTYCIGFEPMPSGGGVGGGGRWGIGIIQIAILPNT